MRHHLHWRPTVTPLPPLAMRSNLARVVIEPRLDADAAWEVIQVKEGRQTRTGPVLNNDNVQDYPDIRMGPSSNWTWKFSLARHSLNSRCFHDILKLSLDRWMCLLECHRKLKIVFQYRVQMVRVEWWEDGGNLIPLSGAEAWRVSIDLINRIAAGCTDV